MPYEKIGKNEPVCIADEVPFDISESWEWVRFKNLVSYSMGKTPPRKESEYWTEPVYPWVSIADMNADSTILSTKEKVNEYAAEKTFRKRISKAGTLLMSFKLTVGKVSLLGIDAYHNEAIISIYPFVDNDAIITNYLFCILPLISQSGQTKTAIKGNTLNSESLDALMIPLPPLREQERICKRLNDLKPKLSAYNKTYNEASLLNEGFPTRLKKSILQYAVQGKLVPQDPADEPASVLLERIRAEKEQLIKSGKIKRDKHESVIFRRDNSYYERADGIERCIDDEIPFEIPDSWEWVRLNSISKILNGDRGKNYPSKSTLSSTGIPFISALNLDGNTVVQDENLLCMTEEQYNRLGNGKLIKNDIVVCIRGSLGKHGRYPFEKGAIASSLTILRPYYLAESIGDYIMLWLDSPAFFEQIRKYDNGTAQPNLAAKSFEQFLIPLPPHSEQHRIIAKVEMFFSKLKTL